MVTYRSDEPDDTADEFDNLTIADMRRFALSCEEAGLSFEGFRRMLVDHDTVLIHALRAGLAQRPFADFREMAERDAYDPSIANLFVESRTASAVGKAARVLVGDSDSFFADVDAVMHRIEQMYEADAGECLPFATLTLDTWEKTFYAYYDAWMREIHNGECVFKYDEGYMRDAPFPPGVNPDSVRMVFMGLLDYDQKSCGFPPIPEGCAPASYEMLMAMTRFPGVLDWLRCRPEGGYRDFVRIRYRNAAAVWVGEGEEELQTTIRFRGSCRAPEIEPIRPFPQKILGPGDVLPYVRMVAQVPLTKLLLKP